MTSARLFLIRSSCFLAGCTLLLSLGQAQAQPAPTAAPPQVEPAPPAPVPAPTAEPAPTATPAPEAAAMPPIPVAAAPEPAPVVELPAAPPPATPAATPAPSGLKVVGSFWTRYEARAGKLATAALNNRGNSDKLFYHARVGLSPTPLDLGDGYSTTFYFEPQASGFYDVSGGVGSDELGLGLHQGYATLASGATKFDIGRFEMNYGEELVIGSLGWHQTGRAFNGGRLHLASAADSMWVDFFATLMDEGSDALAPPPNSVIGALDYYFAGVYAGLGPMIGKLDLDLYLLSKIYTGGSYVDPTMGRTSIDPALHPTLGARFKGSVDMLDYRIETGLQFGARKDSAPIPPPTANVRQPTDALAYQADGELGITPVERLRFGAGGFYASGDDPTTPDVNEGWDQLFPTAHKFLGLTDVMGGRSNVGGGLARASYGLSNTVNAGLDAHFFARPQDTVTPAGTRPSGYAGTEVDFNLSWNIFSALKLRGMYGIFLPSADGPFGTDKPQHYLEIELAQLIK